MARKLYYFDLKGYAEGIRYLLHYGGLEFEDVRFTREEFPKIKESLDMPFGKVPLYVEGDRVLNQSQVIAKYIGKQIGLVPSDPWEEAQIEAAIHTIHDFTPELRLFILEQDPEKKEELKKKLLEETVVFYLSRFDKILANNKGHFGAKLSWGDITFVAMIETISDFLEIDIEAYKNISTLYSEVRGLKGIKEYIAKRDTK